MQEPRIGDQIKVFPKPGLRVQVDGIHGRFLSENGQSVVWSEWYHLRLRDGSILLHSWQPADAESEEEKE